MLPIIHDINRTAIVRTRYVFISQGGAQPQAAAESSSDDWDERRRSARAPRLTPNVNQPVTFELNAWLDTTTTVPAIARARLLMKRWLTVILLCEPDWLFHQQRSPKRRALGIVASPKSVPPASWKRWARPPATPVLRPPAPRQRGPRC